MEDIFVFDGGAVAVDTNGSIGTTNQKAHVSLKSLHVQDKGTFQMKTYTTQNQFTMEATNITVRLTVKIVYSHVHSFPLKAYLIIFLPIY